MGRSPPRWPFPPRMGGLALRTRGRSTEVLFPPLRGALTLLPPLRGGVGPGPGLVLLTGPVANPADCLLLRSRAAGLSGSSTAVASSPKSRAPATPSDSISLTRVLAGWEGAAPTEERASLPLLPALTLLLRPPALREAEMSSRLGYGSGRSSTAKGTGATPFVPGGLRLRLLLGLSPP